MNSNVPILMDTIINDEDALQKAVIEKLNEPDQQFTFSELEILTGVSRSYIHNIKKGKLVGSLSAIMRLATILEIKYRFDGLRKK